MSSDIPSTSGSETRLLNNERFLRKIAEMYYEDGHSQETIAEMEFCSRQTVSKALQKAKERGIVRISIVPDIRVGYLRNLSREARATFRLEDVVLIPGRSFENLSQDQIHNDIVVDITDVAAEYLDQLLTDMDILAVSGGRTFMRNTVRHLKPSRKLPHLKVVAMLGFTEAFTSPGDANLIAHDIAEAYGGKHIWCCLPAFFVPSSAIPSFLTKMIPEDPIMGQALALQEKASVVITTLWTPHSHIDLLTRGILSQEQIDSIEQFNPAADINHWVFDAQGQCINDMLEPPPYYLSGFRIPLLKEKIRKEGTKVILVAGGGPSYVPAIHAALKAELASILVTDHITAQSLLEYSSISEQARA